MHYSSITFILPVALSFVGSVAAFAMPLPQDFSGCTKCTSLISTASGCNYNMLEGGTTTPDQIKCMCGINGFQGQYSDCMSCLVNAGYIDASMAASWSTAIVDGCSTLTGGSSTSSSSSSTSSSSSGGSTSTGTGAGTGTGTSSGTSSGNSNSNGNGNAVLSQSGASALSAGSGQFVLGAVAAVGAAFYAL